MIKITIPLAIIFSLTVVIDGANNCGKDENEPCKLRCQDETEGSAALLEIATICQDQMDGCDILFDCESDPKCDTLPASSFKPDDPATYPKARPTGCDDPSLADIAMKCAKTCAICCETPEYNCEDDADGGIDCEANKLKCTDGNWTDIMATYCPRTCGLCNAQISGSCSDKNTGCKGIASLCKNIDFVDYMRVHCARTCNLCQNNGGTGNCRDMATNCAQNQNLCQSSLYRDLMQQQCCATCGGGQNGGMNNNCADTNQNCNNWVQNGFCTSNFYTSDQKRQYCARSCNLCY